MFQISESVFYYSLLTIRQVLLYSFHQWGIRSLERLSNLPKVALLVNGGTEI
jgi:hypothetical protein